MLYDEPKSTVGPEMVEEVLHDIDYCDQQNEVRQRYIKLYNIQSKMAKQSKYQMRMKFSSTQRMIRHQDFINGTCKMRQFFASNMHFFCFMLSPDDDTLRWAEYPDDEKDLTTLVGLETEIIEKIVDIIGKNLSFV